MIYEDALELAVQKEVTRIRRILSSLPAPSEHTNIHGSLEYCYDRVERRARVSVMGKIAGGHET